jgi:hypothetical protein
MKGITYLIIASVVWSIISGIIEKRKAKAKLAAQAGRDGASDPQAGAQTWKADPVSVKVESLRRRRKQQPPKQQQTPVPKRKSKRGFESIKPLHKAECPVPSLASLQKKPTPAKQLAKMLKNRRNMRTAIVLSEILGKPVSQR